MGTVQMYNKKQICIILMIFSGIIMRETAVSVIKNVIIVLLYAQFQHGYRFLQSVFK